MARKHTLPELAGVGELVEAVAAHGGPRTLQYPSNLRNRLRGDGAPPCQLVANGRWPIWVKADALAWLLTGEPARWAAVPRLAGRYEVAVATGRSINHMTDLLRAAVEGGRLEGQHLKAGWVVPYAEAVALLTPRQRPGARPKPAPSGLGQFRRSLAAAAARQDAPRRAQLLRLGRDHHRLSLRELGILAGISHEAVAQILEQDAAGRPPRVNRRREHV
jgi:hypothetical protein